MRQDHRGQKVDLCLPGARNVEREWRVTANGCWLFLVNDENVLKLDNGGGCTTLDILKTTVLYTLEGQILWYRRTNEISIKLL